MPEIKPRLRLDLPADAGTSSNPLPVDSDDEMLVDESDLSDDDTYGETPAVATTGRITNAATNEFKTKAMWTYRQPAMITPATGVHASSLYQVRSIYFTSDRAWVEADGQGVLRDH
jgi:hypothetical protein